MIHLSRDKVIIYDAQYTTLNRLKVNIKHFLGPILGAEVAQKCAPFPTVVTITEMGNANICILCDAVKKVKRRVGAHTEFFSKTVELHFQIGVQSNCKC